MKKLLFLVGISVASQAGAFEIDVPTKSETLTLCKDVVKNGPFGIKLYTNKVCREVYYEITLKTGDDIDDALLVNEISEILEERLKNPGKTTGTCDSTNPSL
jgi:hypothetical protein